MGRRILLVDDDIAEISAVKRVLSRAGHEAVLATNTRDAVSSLSQVLPDLVVVGATCEGGEAVAFARKLAEDEATGAIPVVLLGEAAGGPPGTTQLGRPVDPAQLQDEVRTLLQRAAGAPPAAPAPRARPPAGAPRARAADRERLAAADALRARAAQLRRGAPAAAPGRPRAPAATPEARAVAALALDDGPGELEEMLRRAEEAERAAAEKKVRALADRAKVEAAQRAEAERLVVEKARRARAAEEKARAEERARAEAEAREHAEAARGADAARRAAEQSQRAHDEARRAKEESRRAAEAEERARAEERAHAEAETKRQAAARRAQEQARRAAQAEERARTEERARAEAEAHREAEAQGRAEAARRASAAEQKARAEERARAEAEAHREAETQRRAEAARRAKTAEQKARAEAEARQKLEDEVARLRERLEAEKRDHEAQLASVLERAAAEEKAAEELRRMSEADAQRWEQEAEAELRRAIESARAEMEALRRRGEEEARRRAEAESELERLADARAAVANPPQPSEGEEALRRRVQALRPDRRVERAPPFDPPDWLEPASGAPAAAVPVAQAKPSPSSAPAPATAGAAAAPAGGGDAAEADAATQIRPPPPELRSGTVADLPLPRILAIAAREGVGGRLDFQGQWARSVFLEDGRVVGATSSAPEERIEEVALRLSLVTRDQHRQIASAAAALGTRRAAVLLLERGFLKPTELTGLVRRRTEEVVFGVFGEESARFRWTAAAVPADERTALERGPLALAIEGVRRRWLAPRVDAVLGGAGTLLAPAPAAPPAAELALAGDERRVVALADGLRTLDEIVHASPLDPLTTRQVLAGLVLVGALVVRIHTAGKPASVAAAAIDLARVGEKLEHVRRADYFTILGVGRLCTPHEVREAADRLVAEFDPSRYAGLQEDGLPGKLKEILAVVADAREVLADERLRAEYLQGLGG